MSVARAIHYGQKDEHRAVGAGGLVDWDWVRSCLHGFAGTIALEVDGGMEQVRASVAQLRQGT